MRALNIISVVSFGLLPHTARNSSLLTTLLTPPFLRSSTGPHYSLSNLFYLSCLAGSLLMSNLSFILSIHAYPTLFYPSCKITSTPSIFSLSLCIILTYIVSVLCSSPHLLSDTLSVPAYGLRSLSDHEGGVSGAVHTSLEEGDRMVHAGLL